MAGMGSFFLNIIIFVAVLGVGVALAALLEISGLVRSEVALKMVGFGPLAAFWLIGAASGASVFSSYSCLDEYQPLPNGQLLDSFGHEIPPLEAYLICSKAFAGALVFEIVWGAWANTVPSGVFVGVGSNWP